MRSLFSMIARYVPTPKRSPREDILTQAFAATLESADGLASYLVSEWLRDGGDNHATAPSTTSKWQPEITPQRTLSTGERVDLELDFRDGSGKPDLLLWVEVKHQAHLSGSSQLRKYADALACEPHPHRRLVFLPPAGYVWAPDECRPSELCETSWHRVGEILRSWRDRDQDQSSQQVWIVDQFLEFLEEERLFMSHPLTTEQLCQLRAARIAEPQFNALVEEARGQIDGWFEGSGLPSSYPWHQWPTRGPLRWPEFWRTYGSIEILDGDAWFEWSFLTPQHPSIFQGLEVAEGPVFGAGLTVKRSSQRIDERRPAVVAEGLRFVPLERDLPRVFRYTPLESLLEGAQGSLTQQAGALFGFVQTAFESVERALSLPRRVP